MSDSEVLAEEKEEETFWDSKGKVAVAFAIGVVVIWIALGLFASHRDDPGKFGDMFGAASALFSGLAFAGLVYTIALQRSELSSQRRDLSETRRELRAQTAHFEEQNRVMRQQALDGTFFQLLRFHNDLVNDRSSKHSDERAYCIGPRLLQVILQRFRKSILQQKKGGTGPTRHHDNRGGVQRVL